MSYIRSICVLLLSLALSVTLFSSCAKDDSSDGGSSASSSSLPSKVSTDADEV